MKILNCKISSLTQCEILEKIFGFLNSNDQHRIVTINPEYILEAQKDKEFQNIINSADLIAPDGVGILWATKFLSMSTSSFKILRYPQIVIQYILSGVSLIFLPKYCRMIIKERVSGADIVESMFNSQCSILNKISMSNFQCPKIFLLGGFNDAGKQIQKQYSSNIVGTYEGSPDLENDEKIREVINQMKPDILFVAYGNPASRQEKWISRNLKYLSSVKVAMGVGGSFDFLSGNIKRAPKWIQAVGLEWLWRLARQPRRYKRIWNAVILFSFKVLKYKLINYTPS